MKKILALILALILIAIPSYALAEGNSYIENSDFSTWINGSPEGWTFYSPTGILSQDEHGRPVISLENNDFGLLFQQITLKPETCYLITCDVLAENVSESVIGANINFSYQGAYSDLIDDELVLCVRTNTSEVQDYVLNIGIGSENNPASGKLTLGALTIKELSEIPEDMPVYSLIGEIGIDGYGTGDDSSTSSEDNSETVQEYPSYNAIGPALCCVFLIAALYLLITGRNGKKLGDFMATRYTMYFVFAFAFLLRLYIAINTTGHSTDLNCFTAWSNMTHEYGLSGFYESGLFADYPPGYMYVLWIIGAIANLLGISQTSQAMILFVKLPSIICDLAIAYLAYRFAKNKLGKGSGALMSLLVMLSPMLIIVSCAWAQIDSVFTLAILVVCILLYQNKTTISLCVWMLALMIKPQALLIAPLIAIILITDLIKKDTRKNTLKEIFIALPAMFAIYAVISLPMKGGQGFFYVFERMLGTVGQYDYGSVNAANLFALAGGNFVESSKPFLFGTYKTLGWLFIGLITAITAILYYRKKQRKYVFLLGGLYLSSIFMLSHSMHERYLFPAVILLLFAAIIHNSRRLLSCYSALTAAAFLNIYLVLVFDQASCNIPYIALAICSILSIAAFVWLIVCTVYHYKGKADKPLKQNFCEFAPFAERSMNAARQRLSFSPDKSRRLNKKDYILMLAITVVYAAVAFINLGSTNIPEPAAVLDHEGDSIVIELSEESFIETMWHYAGYCEGYIEVSVSSDGEHYTLASESSEHEYADMFRWQPTIIASDAKYVKITLNSGYMEFREIGFTDSNRSFLHNSSAKYIYADGSSSDASAVIDEYDELPHDGTSYMQDMYFDEVYHARTAYEYIHGIYPYEITHPPLGKAFIALGCMIFGFNPFGWRFMGTLAGVLMLPVLYIFAKRLFKNTKWAAYATALFSVEFMHYVQTRIATIDSYSVLFIMLMYLCMYEYSQHNFLKEKLSKTLLPLGLCGLFFALGAATKWICLYAGPGLCILFFYTVYQRTKEYKYAKNAGLEDIVRRYKKNLTLTISFCVGVFIALPICVYILSYYPYYNACNGNYGLKEVWENQVYMFTYHENLSGDPHPFQSSVYTWPFIIRPVYFFMGENMADNMRAVIWCMGNPLIFIGGLACVIGLIGVRSEPKTKLTGIPFISIAALCQILPWILITREVFIYHYFSTIPFLILAITYFMRYICEKHGKKGKYFAIAFLAVSALLFILFYPPITGTPMNVWYARLIRWSPLWPISL